MKRTAQSLKALDAIFHRCDRHGAVAKAFLAAQSATEHAAAIWRREHPGGEPEFSTAALALAKLLKGDAIKTPGSNFYRAAVDRRAAAFAAFYATPAANEWDLLLKLATMVLHNDATGPLDFTDEGPLNKVLAQLRADALGLDEPPGAG